MKVFLLKIHMWLMASGCGVHPATLSDAQGRVHTQVEEVCGGGIRRLLEVVTFGPGLRVNTKLASAVLLL